MGRAIPRVQNQLRATDHPKGRTFALWCVSEYSNIPPFIRPTSAEMWCALMVSGDMENWARGDMRNWTPSISAEVGELSGLRAGAPQLADLRDFGRASWREGECLSVEILLWSGSLN